MTTYSTVTSYLESIGGESRVGENRIFKSLRQASNIINNSYSGRRGPLRSKMYPQLGSRFFDAWYRDGTMSIVSRNFPYQLRMKGFEFMGTPVITYKGTILNPTTYVILPSSTEVKHIERKDRKTWLLDNNQDDYRALIEITGVEWVFRLDGETGWFPNTTLVADINDTVTSFIVSSASDLGIGSLIQIGTEMMDIIKITDDTVTVKERGVNGSTAVLHLASAVVNIYEQEYEVEQACNVLTQMLLKKPGSTTVFPNSGAIVSEDNSYTQRIKTLLNPYGIWSIA